MGMGETTRLRLRGHEARRYFRKWARNVVQIPARVEILTADGKRFTQGSAIIRDVSLRGARLGRIVLKKACLPARAFRIRLFFRSEKYRGIGAVCRPVRFGPGPEFELAVEFEDFWASTGSRDRSSE
jgi:hypothetical protein